MSLLHPFSDRLYTGPLSKTGFLEINSSCVLPFFLQYEWNFPSTRVAFLLANLNPDFAIENSIFCSIKDQTNLRLQSERSTSERGSFRLVS